MKRSPESAEKEYIRPVRPGSAKDWQSGENLEKEVPKDATIPKTLSREELLKRIKELREKLQNSDKKK
ncbi:MAG: hypothetical protein AAB420_03340 [Patescibacteria group bacterium]